MIINYYNLLYIQKEAGNNMFFMISWWIVLAILIILFLISYSSKNRTIKRKLDRVVGFLSVFQLLLLIVTIALRDPIFEAIGLPKEYEWLAGLLLSGFTLWQFYLSPLKERVIKTEKEVGIVKNNVEHIKETTDKLEKKFFS